jgi:hypothetical protein
MPLAMADPTTLFQFTMDDQNAVKCLDGSAPTIYYDNMYNSDPDLWVIAFQGSNLPMIVHGNQRGLEPTTYEDYLHICRSDSADVAGNHDQMVKGLCDTKGSGKNPAGNHVNSIEKGGLFDSDPTMNEFAAAQKIWVNSCTMDAWMGSGEVAGNDADFPTLYFHGKDLVHYVFERLRTQGLMGNSIDSANDRVLMVGESGGSTAVFAHLDTVCDDLRSHAGVTECKGATFSAMPGLHKPQIDASDNDSPIWVDFLQRRKDRYLLTGATHSANCQAAFPNANRGITPLGDWQLDPSDISRTMCFSNFGKLKSLQNSIFIGYNRGNKGPDDLSWTAGCDYNENDYHGANCFNDPEIRDTDIGTVLLQAKLPVGSAARIMPGSRHLFAFNKDPAQLGNAGVCDPNTDDTCWGESVQNLQYVGSNLSANGSYRRALDFFWNNEPWGGEIICANDYCE